MSTTIDYIVQNPFWVLELPTSATPQEVARQKQKILGMLELNIKSALTFDSPQGPRPRDPFLLRQAASSLDDATGRLLSELWAGRRGTGSDADTLSWPKALIAIVETHMQLHYGESESLTRNSYENLCSDWTELLNSTSFRDKVLKRAATLGVLNPGESLGLFRQSVSDALGILLPRSPFDLDGLDSELAKSTASHYQSQTAETLRLTASRLQRSENWQERLVSWVIFREQYKYTVSARGSYLRYLLFSVTNDPVSELAGDAYENNYYRFAKQLYDWIREEATLVGSDSEVTRCTFNADLCKSEGKGRLLQEVQLCRHCASCVRSGTFCSECGKRLKNRFCHSCGALVVHNFCSKCGTATRNLAAGSPSVAPAMFHGVIRKF